MKIKKEGLIIYGTVVRNFQFSLLNDKNIDFTPNTHIGIVEVEDKNFE